MLDELKYILRIIECNIEVFILCFLYYAMGAKFYPDSGFCEENFEKHLLVGLYAIMVLIIFYLCDGFKFGHLKLTDVIISQCISITIVNIISYLHICLILKAMVSVGPIISLTFTGYIIMLILVYIYTWVYHRIYVPQNMLLIYSNKNGINLKFKMDKRSDKYKVTNIICISEDQNYIKSEILKHDAVVLNDIPAQIRNDLLKYCYKIGIRTYIVPKISDIIITGSRNIALFDTPLMLVNGKGLTYIQRAIKRIIDLILCMAAFFIFSPLMIIVGIAIKLEDGGPVFYRQKRATYNGKEFNIIKFRSMNMKADTGGYDISMRASTTDSRITKIGSFIRRYRIDELPQIFNIFKGDMSVVGPRPERIENVKYYSKEIPEFEYRLQVKCGLTGYAQVYGKYNTTPYDKLRLDLMYIENYSIFLDIKIIFMTLRTIFKLESTEGFDMIEEFEKHNNEI